jgi:carbon starvation protein CstA
MKDLDLATLIAVFQEMLGWTLWPIIALALLASVAFLWVVLRDRSLLSRRLVWAEICGLGGGIAAVLIMQRVTHSGFADLGGPIDWLLVFGIFVFGAIGAALGFYALFGLLAGGSRKAA